MKHVSSYFEYLYEGKKQYLYTVVEGQGFNVFDLLNELKKFKADVLSNVPNKKGETILTIALEESLKTKVEEVIQKTAQIISVE
jgi:hypothetical protein